MSIDEQQRVTAAASGPKPADEVLLELTDLRVGGPGGELVHGVSLRLRRGHVVGIVGESGSGKTLTCRALLGILPRPLAVTGGSVRLLGRDAAAMTPKQWKQLRGTAIAAVFQDPASYLNPSIRVGRQLAEVLRVRGGLSRRTARERALELLRAVRLRDPEHVYSRYVHELSGGMLQRILIAAAIALEPEILVADEVTTALDVTVQSEVLDLLTDLKDRIGLSLIVVSHDLAVVAQICDEVLVLRDGEVVEHGPTDRILFDPRHDYTRLLVEEHGRFGLDRVLAPEPAAGETTPGETTACALEREPTRA